MPLQSNLLLSQYSMYLYIHILKLNILLHVFRFKRSHILCVIFTLGFLGWNSSCDNNDYTYYCTFHDTLLWRLHHAFTQVPEGKYYFSNTVNFIKRNYTMVMWSSILIIIRISPKTITYLTCSSTKLMPSSTHF